MPLLSLLFASALARPDADALVAAWSAAQPALSAARLRHQPTASDLRALAAQGSFKRVEATETGTRMLTGCWIDAPVLHTWLVFADNFHRTISEETARIQGLPGNTAFHRLNHVLLDLPWPLTDRQWVAEISGNAALWQRSGQSLAEFSWDIADAALAPSPDPDALWVPVNHGGWNLLGLEQGTLALFGARLELGGAVPDDVSARVGLTRIDETFTRVRALAADMPQHYSAGHSPLPDPAGQPLPYTALLAD